MNFDDWLYLEVCYFWVIIFIIIGYGDYIVGFEICKKGIGNLKIKVVKFLNVVFYIVWIMIGLCVFFSVFNVVVMFIEK